MGVKTRNLGNSEGKDLQWQTPLNADGSTIFNLTSGEGYFLNTTGGTIEAILPSSPALGDTIAIVDIAGTFGTNKVFLRLNGNKLNGTNNPSGIANQDDFVGIEADNARLELIYSGADKGWIHTENANIAGPTDGPFAAYTSATGGTVTESGDFKIHTITGDGCFVVSSVGNPAGGGAVSSYLVVAGGGAGGTDRSAGGGAGGFRFFSETAIPGSPAAPLNAPAGITLTASTTYPITVGAGGTAGASNTAASNAGSNSVFSTITSAGGGFGNADGNAGGAGAGGSGGGGANSRCGANGNTPPVSPPQGTAGGNSNSGSGGGGGGGAVQAGGNMPSAPVGGTGGAGAGMPAAIFGANGECSSCVRYFAGGGGGGANTDARNGGLGGAGDGDSGSGGAGTANTGGGGGGSGQYSSDPSRRGGAGGKGIVVLRYKFQN